MLAARLHGPSDLRLVEIPAPIAPGAGEVLLRIGAVGVCGSDLHMYETGGIGGREVAAPFTLGHEFMGTVVDLAPDARDGLGQPLQLGQRVAVDPAVPCGRCENCREGNPNLCPTHTFFGVPPDQGALCGRFVCPGENCFPLPDDLSDAAGALLEPLGVAIHAVDLARLRVAQGVAIFGAGPIGLLILSLARIAGADPIYVFDPLANRRDHAFALGASAVFDVPTDRPLAGLDQATDGRGVDVGIEAAWADRSVQLTFDATRYGGRVVLVGIPPDDRCTFSHASARRKGLTVRFARRMKHTYPRALALARHPLIASAFERLVTHRFPLAKAPEAFALNVAYGDGLLKAIIEVS